MTLTILDTLGNDILDTVKVGNKVADATDKVQDGPCQPGRRVHRQFADACASGRGDQFPRVVHILCIGHTRCPGW